VKICRIQTLVALAALAIGSFAASQVQAAALVPASVLIPAATDGGPLDGTSLLSTTTGFSVAGAFSGDLTTEVYSGNSGNPYGGLTFVYTLSNDGASGPNSIGRMSLASFLGFSVGAAYEVDGGIAPASIDRNPSGDVIGFNFVPTPLDVNAGFMGPGLSSSKLIIHTDATAYTAAVASLIDGGVTTVPTVGPVVPEPSTVVLALGAIASLGALRLRRR
jgi:hypothetical protein